MKRWITRVAELVMVFAFVTSLNAVEIAFTRSDNNKNGRIQILRDDGSIFTPSGQKGVNKFPTWSPEGDTLAFISDRNSRYEIWFMDADGSNQRTYEWLNQLQLGFVGWSPKGNVLLAEAGVLYEIDLTTREKVQEIRVAWGNPASFSPDGENILVGKLVDGGPELWVMDTAGATHSVITGRSYFAFCTWSPDSQRIAFQGLPKKDGPTEIFTVNVDGTGLKQVTDSPATAGNQEPSWVDNRTLVIAATNRQKNESTIYSIRVDGSGMRKLVEGVLAEGFGAPAVRPSPSQSVTPADRMVTTWGKIKQIR